MRFVLEEDTNISCVNNELNNIITLWWKSKDIAKTRHKGHHDMPSCSYKTWGSCDIRIS